MTEQPTATMRFVRGASAPAPLADPATEEEAVLVSDTQAAIQRLREALEPQRWLTSRNPQSVVHVADVRALIDALDAAGPLLAAARAYATAEADANRLWGERSGSDNGYLDAHQRQLRAERALLLAATATPRAAAPDAT